MKKNTTPILKQIEDYFRTVLKLWKYEAIERSSGIVAKILTDLLLFILALLALIFLTITLALFLGQALGSDWEGFGCVAILYLLLVFLAVALKLTIQKKLTSMIVRKLFKGSK